MRAASKATTTIRETAADFHLTPSETANELRVSTSWLAKARMRGDGPPFYKFGRAVRYSKSGIAQWLRSRQRFSTSG